MVTADSAPAALPVVRWERAAVVLLLGLFVAVGINNILNQAFVGQDFSFHVGCTNQLLGRPDAWFAQDVTNRPLIYWIAVDGIYLTDNRAAFEFAAAVFLLLNTGALWLLHDSSRRFIGNAGLRVAALALIAFAPVTLITTVVFAADAMAMPPFALLCWSLIRWSEVPSERSGVAYAALAGCALAVGNFAKFTFILLPLGVLVVGGLAWRWRLASAKRLAVLAAFAVVAPGLVGLWLDAKCRYELRDVPQQHRFTWSGTGEMTWRSLLGLKASDARIFNAPGYWDFTIVDGQKVLPLIADNHYSYPALLHLAIFTDVLDFSNGGSRNSGAPRPEPQKTFSQWAVRLGLVFSLPGLWAVGAVATRTLRSLRDPRTAPPFALATWLVPGAVWLVPLVITLPFVHHAYGWGYWLPRLVLPGLWAAGLALFAWLDVHATSRPRLVGVVAACTAVQTTLHVLSVWY
jgi:hypothetical protein